MALNNIPHVRCAAIEVLSETAGTSITVLLVLILIVFDAVRFGRVSLSTQGFVVALIISTIITYALKISLQMPRPGIESVAAMENPLKYVEVFSFPSGHSARAFALATYFSNRVRSRVLSASLYAWATGVAITRLILGVHWFSDVLAGSVVGILSAVLADPITVYINKFLPKRVFQKKLM